MTIVTASEEDPRSRSQAAGMPIAFDLFVPSFTGIAPSKGLARIEVV
jgi:hypothetical protein